CNSLRITTCLTNKTRSVTTPRPVRCFNCHKLGHKRYECKQSTNPYRNQPPQQDRGINLLESERVDADDNEVLEVQRRKNLDVSTNPYKMVQPRTKTTKEQQQQNMDVTMQEDTKSAEPKKQVNKEPTPLRMAEKVKPFSLSDELATFYPHISFPQLLEVSPKLSNELSMLNKKVKKTEINEIWIEEPKQSNCKIVASVFGKEIVAIVDTGAVCSVATPDLIEIWGLVPEPDEDQIIITADGKRHHTNGKLTDLPLAVGGIEFSVDMIIMDRADNTLILGTDFLQKYKVIIDLRSRSIKIPIKNAELVVPMHISLGNKNMEPNHMEIYLMAKPDSTTADETDKYDDSRFEELREEYSELFVEDLEELTQTDVVEHTIDLTDEKAIKQRPYRIPYHLQQKVRDELRIIEENKIISPCASEWCSPMNSVSLTAESTVTQKQDIPSHAEDRIPWARVDNRRNWYQPSKDCSYSEVSKAQFSEGIAVISRTHRNTNWTWDEEKGKAFEQLKEALCSPSTLAHPDWSQEFILTTDASIKGIGGILSQSNGGEEKPRNTFGRSCADMVNQKLKYYLWGRHFTIRTDHKSLIKLFEGSENTGRVARWAMILRNYDYTITHCPGKNNPADALTRLEQEKSEEPMETIDICTLDYLYYEAIKNYLGTFSYPNNSDESFRKKLRAKSRKYKLQGDKLVRIIKGATKEVLHEKNAYEVIKSIHVEGHFGIENTWRSVIEKYTGEGLFETVKAVVKQCEVCQLYKGSR
ncbi:Retrovirus-related Pol polyprotein from transposon, partial [Zancudomyces culisetae]